jgi:uncharacterized protein YegL
MRKYLLLLFIFFCFGKNILAEDPGDRQSILCLIDVSGSMKGQKLDSVKSAAKQIVGMLLSCNVEFSIIGYAGKSENPFKYYKNFSVNKTELLSFIDSLQSEGNTPLGAALKAASFSFKNNKDKRSKRQTIILLCDGRSDDDIASALKTLKERNSLIQCECIGFDIDNDKLAQSQLKDIANTTGGEYYNASDAAKVVKNFYKSGIKTIIKEIPVTVRERNKNFDFPQVRGNVQKMLTAKNWMVDSIQVNAATDIFNMVEATVENNIQDTLPKSLVFDNEKVLSVFINEGTNDNPNKKWIEGKYLADYNVLSITLRNHVLKLVIKKINSRSLVFCVNQYADKENDMVGSDGELCDCKNKINPQNPYILIYLSQAGCY